MTRRTDSGAVWTSVDELKVGDRLEGGDEIECIEELPKTRRLFFAGSTRPLLVHRSHLMPRIESVST